MAKIYYMQDCNLDYLKKKTVAIIVYGSQGHLGSLAYCLVAHQVTSIVEVAGHTPEA